MYKKLIVRAKNTYAKKEPNDNDFVEILSAVNSHNFATRIDFQEVNCTSPEEPDGENDHCHTIARMYAGLNDGWKRVSGYLIKKDRLNTNTKPILLKAHSVCIDKNNNFIEVMPFIYPLSMYYFVSHNSGCDGYDLELND